MNNHAGVTLACASVGASGVIVDLGEVVACGLHVYEASLHRPLLGIAVFGRVPGVLDLGIVVSPLLSDRHRVEKVSNHSVGKNSSGHLGPGESSGILSLSKHERRRADEGDH